MAKSFSAQVGDFIAKSERLSMAVVQTAAQAVIKEAQKTRARGGNMPVDTGFLRNSGGAAINSESVRKGYQVEAVVATLLRAKPGDFIFFGWVALYAPYMENKYAFAGMAAQKWQQQVDRAARELKRRAGR